MGDKNYDLVDLLVRRFCEAYAEACRSGECDCVTIEEHERMLLSQG